MESARGTKPHIAARLATSSGLWLFLMFLCLYALTNRGNIWSSDAAMRLGMARHLLDTGTVGVPGDLKPHLRVHGGKLVWGLGHPLVLSPAVLVGRGFGPVASRFLGPDADEKLGEILASFSSVPLGALGVLLVYLVGRGLGYRREVSVAAAMALGVATTWWPYTQDAFYEPLQGVCLVAGLLLLLKAGKDRSARVALAAGFCFGFAVLTKLTNLAIAAPLVLALASKDRKRNRRPGRWVLVLCVFLGALPLLALNGWSDYVRYGTAFPSAAERHPKYEGALQHGDILPGVISLATGLTEGLLWYAPPVLAALFFLPGVGKRNRAACIGVMLAVLVGILLTARLDDVGLRGACWGPRYLVPLFPLAALGFLPWFEAVAARGKRLARAMTGLLLAVSVAVQLLAVSVHYQRYYAERADLPDSVRGSLPYTFPLARQPVYLGKVLAGMVRGDPHRMQGEALAVEEDDLIAGSRAVNVLNFWWVLAYYQGVPKVLLALVVASLATLIFLSARVLLLPGHPRGARGAEGETVLADEPS
ncbi:MAG: glycosyltransferase family 39 protein [Armatimonadetes bacterium]|nr:glycosyltransferase family 39 protein [Armatimonadota bacterium]